MTPPASVAVVGAGISGLAAAHRLRTLEPDAEITVYEVSDRIGGVLRTVALGGVAYDVGAEAFLARRPEVGALLDELGLTGELVHPGPAAPAVLAGGQVRALPARTVLGIPSDAQALEGLVSPATLATMRAERSRPWSWTPGADVAVGELVRERLGAEVVERCVDPLLGGVYSGSAGHLGLRAAVPTVAAALDGGATGLLDAATRALPVPRPGEPVFGALRGGYGVLLRALASAADVRLGSPVTGLRRTEDGFELGLSGRTRRVDAVVLAVPAPVLARLLGPIAPAGVAGVGLASVAVVGLAYAGPVDALPATSGLLVGTGEALHAKAFTHSSRKWPHLAHGPVLVRASIGRYGHPQVLERDDAELVELVRADLARVHGLRDVPVDTVVQRWPDGLPQYAPGHTELVTAIEDAVRAVPGLAVAGSVLHGVGVPACIATGRAAGQRVAAHLAGRRAVAK